MVLFKLYDPLQVETTKTFVCPLFYFNKILKGFYKILIYHFWVNSYFSFWRRNQLTNVYIHIDTG